MGTTTRQPQAVALFLLTTLAVAPVLLQAAQRPAPAGAAQAPAAGAAQAPGALSLKLAGLPSPKKGQAYRFSLCTGMVLGPDDVSQVCNPGDAAGVAGNAQNLPIVFRLETTSFLPPGFTLDGNGVINGAPGADLSKLKAVRICAFQVGGFGTNFASRCQQVDFRGLRMAQPAPKAGGKAGGNTALKAAVAGGVGLGGLIAVKKAMDGLKASTDEFNQAVNGGSTTTTGSTGYNGTYDFQFVFTNPPPTPDTSKTLSQFFRVNNGVITASDGTLSGSVSSSGSATFVGPCPINNDPADFTGSLTTSGTGSGTYRCRTGGISRSWSVLNRR